MNMHFKNLFLYHHYSYCIIPWSSCHLQNSAYLLQNTDCL